MIQTFDAEETLRALPFGALLGSMEAAFARAIPDFPPRARHSSGPGQDTLTMHAWSDRHAVTKLIHVRPENANRAEPIGSVQPTVIVCGRETGVPKAVIDGASLTARRTAAASALAAKKLSPADATQLVIVATGALATELARAHVHARPSIAGGSIVMCGRGDPGTERACSLVDRVRNAVRDQRIEDGGDAASGPVVTYVSTRDDTTFHAALRTADVVSCATLSVAPIVRWSHLAGSDGDASRDLGRAVHVDLVGAYRPDMRETDAALIGQAAVFVDTVEGANHEAGDLLQAEQENLFSLSSVTEDRAFASWASWSRPSGNTLTVFKSVGAAIEDVVAAELVVEKMK